MKNYINRIVTKDMRDGTLYVVTSYENGVLKGKALTNPHKDNEEETLVGEYIVLRELNGDEFDPIIENERMSNDVIVGN